MAKLFHVDSKQYTEYSVVYITRENIFHRNSFHGKSFPTGIDLIARVSLVTAWPKLSINCSNIANTNHPIKIKHFHMVCTKL